MLQSQAFAGQPLISEIRIDQPSSDNDEYFELAAAAGASLNGLTYLVIGDGTGGSGVIEAVVDLDGLSIPASGFFVAAEASFTLGAADLTASLNFENSDNVTHLLVRGFSGLNGDDLDSDDDGNLDIVPWSEQLDCVALVETPGSGDRFYCSNTAGPDGSFVPGHVFRCGNGFEIGGFSLGTDDSPGALNSCPSFAALNEVRIDQPGTDNDEYFELWGSAGGSLDGLTYLVIGDGAGGSGTIEEAEDLSGNIIPSSGFFVAAESTFSLGTADLTLSLNFENSDNVTHLLVRDFTGANGDDLDSDDDGVLDSAPWSEQLDCLALVETPASGDRTYCDVSLGPDGPFVPGHAFRCSDDDWEIGQFDPSGGDDSPGAGNPCTSDVQVELSEVRIDQPSTDNDEYFELSGDAGALLNGLTYLVIGDGSGGSGVIEEAVSLNGQIIPASGFFVAAEGTFTLGSADLIVSLNFENSDNVTHLVVRDFTGSDGDDLDSDDDGTLDAEPWSELVDCVALIETPGSGEQTYCPAEVGPDGSFVPAHAFRCEEGFRIGPFNPVGGKDTPGGENDCELEPTGWVINEIHADPAGNFDCSNDFGLPDECGDANGDGRRNATDDEFVEIVNITGSDQDISGWTLSDGFGLRHTFAEGTVVPDNCAIVVFGDGPFLTFFGGAVLQEASSGALGLNNGGDSVSLADGGAAIQAMASYGGEGGNDRSLTLDPDITGSGLVQHTSAAGSGGTLFSPGRLVDGSSFSGCPSGPSGAVEIHEIQGSGLQTPFPNFIVTTLGNIVTAVGSSGFFMQAPDVRADADPATSEGIFVFTGTAPTVQVGDQVDVTGLAVDFFGLTEITDSPIVSVDSTGNPLPAVIAFNSATPSPTPSLLPDLERFEGMLVSFSGIASGPSDGFGDVPVVVGSDRAFREPGIEFPGLANPPGLPVWDGNPEVFEIDPDGLGGADEQIFAGQEVAAEGPLTFSFGDYQVLPTTLLLGPEPVLPRPVRSRAAGEFTIGTLNLLRLDSASSGFADQAAKLSRYIREVLGAPDILAVQEAEDIATLQALADVIQADESSLVYKALLEEGNDPSGIDVGFLLRDDTVQEVALTQFGKALTFDFNGQPRTTYDRPPLILDALFIANGTPFPVTVIANHFRSLNDIESSEFARLKRFEQAFQLSLLIQSMQTADPNRRLVVAGDFNAFQFSDGFVDVMGQVSGILDPLGALLPGSDEVDPNLANQVLTLAEAERYSFIFEGNSQAIDHALASSNLEPFLRGAGFGRGNADSPDALEDVAGTALRASDHDGLAVFLMSDRDGDGLADDADRCPASDLSPTVVIDGCDSGVPNTFFPDGCTISDQVAECADLAANHGEFSSCVSELTNSLKAEGIISGAQKGAIQSCAAQANLP